MVRILWFSTYTLCLTHFVVKNHNALLDMSRFVFWKSYCDSRGFPFSYLLKFVQTGKRYWNYFEIVISQKVVGIR